MNTMHVIGEPIEFKGYVETHACDISGMEFSLDNGVHWTSYPSKPNGDSQGFSWRFVYTPLQQGLYCLRARAILQGGQPSHLISTIPFMVASGSKTTKADRRAYSRRLESDKNNLTGTEPADEIFKQWGDFAKRIGLRALGNRPLESSLLFRSGRLDSTTALDASLIGHLGIRTIYDIRTEREVMSNPDPYFEGVCTIALTPSLKRRPKNAKGRLIAGVIGEYGKPEARMISNYQRYVKEYPLIGYALRSIAEKKTAALIHCENGKDRTGVLCAILQRIAGISMDDILDDYLEYNVLNSDKIDLEAQELGVGMNAFEKSILMSFIEARPSYLVEFFNEIDRQFGSFERYVEEGLKLNSTQQETLQCLVGGFDSWRQ